MNDLANNTSKFILSRSAYALVCFCLSGSNLLFADENVFYDKEYKLAYDAYIYNYPLVKNYLSLYQYALDKNSDQYKGPINQVNNVDRVFTPKDTGVITPNSDTPYSFLVMDLTSEPLVITLPAIESKRYYSVQIVDLYTNNVDYLGTRKDGNSGGDFLIVGPQWKGEKPQGIKRVIKVSTNLALGLFRTQLFSPDDITDVKKIQSGYKARTLSKWTGNNSAQAKYIEYPIIDDAQFNDKFWQYANFLLQFSPELPKEKKLRREFYSIGNIPGKQWPSVYIGDNITNTVRAAQKDADTYLHSEIRNITTSVGLFGSPDEMSGKYLQRALGAMAGIYGNSPQEAMYPTFQKDKFGNELDGSKSKYTMTFPKGKLPPVNAFWSITMYDASTQFLVENKINRYLINSSMVSNLKENRDGSVTIYIQHNSPGTERESNWLPAPNGPMSVVMRLYLPKESALKGEWNPPAINISE